MAPCGSFHHLFENPRAEKTLLESLSSPSPWNHNPATEDETPPFTEIFGELHFRAAPDDNYDKTNPPYATTSSLQLCTEGLGSESSYDVEEVNVNVNGGGGGGAKGIKGGVTTSEAERLRRRRREEYPPAMKRMSLMKAYRGEGRFVLEEAMIPRREILRATRQDGRLMMKLIQAHEDELDE